MSMVTEEHGETYGTNKWKINRKRLNIKVLSSLPYEEGDLFGHNAMRCCGTLLCPAVAHGVFYKNTLSTNHIICIEPVLSHEHIVSLFECDGGFSVVAGVDNGLFG